MQSLLEDGAAHQRVYLRLSHPDAAESASFRIPVDELLTGRFISRHTKFPSFAALLGASGFSAERFANIEGRTDRSWDEFIGRASDFSDWSEMLRDARGEWMMRRLGILVHA